uniref:Uncharacterized protein n=1 Tax=Physcomitrium patens TaxID=3218 RepID=A0A2K1JLG8_PHYPA|nr:hypothetical protein PHYPA_017206 [Physcomitrium patens]
MQKFVAVSANRPSLEQMQAAIERARDAGKFPQRNATRKFRCGKGTRERVLLQLFPHSRTRACWSGRPGQHSSLLLLALNRTRPYLVYFGKQAQEILRPISISEKAPWFATSWSSPSQALTESALRRPSHISSISGFAKAGAEGKISASRERRRCPTHIHKPPSS